MCQIVSSSNTNRFVVSHKLKNILHILNYAQYLQMLAQDQLVAHIAWAHISARGNNAVPYASAVTGTRINFHPSLHRFYSQARSQHAPAICTDQPNEICSLVKAKTAQGKALPKD